jgi:hypothetical protein
MADRTKSPEERAHEVEFFRRRSLPGVQVRRMFTDRVSDLVLSHTGRDLGSRTEVTKRGKVVSVLYVLPALPTDLNRPAATE